MQVQPKAPLLQILRVAGAQEEIFTLKEVCTACCQCNIELHSLTIFQPHLHIIYFCCYARYVTSPCLSCVIEKGASLSRYH